MIFAKKVPSLHCTLLFKVIIVCFIPNILNYDIHSVLRILRAWHRENQVSVEKCFELLTNELEKEHKMLLTYCKLACSINYPYKKWSVYFSKSWMRNCAKSGENIPSQCMVYHLIFCNARSTWMWKQKCKKVEAQPAKQRLAVIGAEERLPSSIASHI